MQKQNAGRRRKRQLESKIPNIARTVEGHKPYGGGKRCRNARLVASGCRLRYPSYREGYAAMLAP